MIEHVAHEAAAIEAGLRTGSAPAVGDSCLADGVIQKTAHRIGKPFQERFAFGSVGLHGITRLDGTAEKQRKNE